MPSDQLKISDQVLDVMQERGRQDIKWGEQNHDPFTWTTILMEEVGEFCHDALAICFGSKQGVASLASLRREAVQVAAVALAIVESIDRGKWSWPVQLKKE